MKNKQKEWHHATKPLEKFIYIFNAPKEVENAVKLIAGTYRR
jgi:hypothetical protein